MNKPTTIPAEVLAQSSRPPQVCIAVQHLLDKVALMNQTTSPRPDFPPRLRITSAVDFHHRGGRTWMRTPIEVAADEFTDQQIGELMDDPELTVEKIDEAPPADR